VVPLTIDPQGALHLAESGATIDWLVQMRRLPAERMLDYAMAHGTVCETDVQRVGALLARFYTQTPPAVITPSTYRQRLGKDVQANRQELVLPMYGLPVALVESALAAQCAFLEQESALFDSRAQAGRIIEAHGDLRPEHICLEDAPVIIDCLEFDRALRILDTVSELAFLMLECERLGAPQVGHHIFDTYCRATGDHPPERLLAFYRSYHAGLRAKVAVWHLKDASVRHPAIWTEKATHYLRLAAGLPPGVGHR
jgi:aminoglycoside phosphotransferase family enzyme